MAVRRGRCSELIGHWPGEPLPAAASPSALRSFDRLRRPKAGSSLLPRGTRDESPQGSGQPCRMAGPGMGSRPRIEYGAGCPRERRLCAQAGDRFPSPRERRLCARPGMGSRRHGNDDYVLRPGMGSRPRIEYGAGCPRERRLCAQAGDRFPSPRERRLCAQAGDGFPSPYRVRGRLSTGTTAMCSGRGWVPVPVSSTGQAVHGNDGYVRRLLAPPGPVGRRGGFRPRL